MKEFLQLCRSQLLSGISHPCQTGKSRICLYLPQICQRVARETEGGDVMKEFLQLCRSQLLSGISLGLALMVSALFAVYSFGDSAISVRWMNLLPRLTVLYVLAGVLLMAWHRRLPRRRPATPYLSGLNAWYIWVLPAFLWWLLFWHRRLPRRRPATPYLSGLNAWYIWVLPAFLWWLLFDLTSFDVLERCLLFNLILLAALWTIEYSMARRMTKALNGALGTRSPTVMPTSLIVDLDDCPKGTEAFCIEIERYCIKNHIDKALNGALGTRSPTVMPTSLIVDLDDCPKGTEAFCIEIERYCIKNHIDYQFVERDKPAIILMNGVKHRVELGVHRVELGVYYGYVPGWFLKFTEL